MKHRPQRWRSVLFVLTCWVWATVFFFAVTLKARWLWRLHGRALDWLHTGCPACPHLPEQVN